MLVHQLMILRILLLLEFSVSYTYFILILFIVCSVSFIVCVVLCAVFICVWCVFILCSVSFIVCVVLCAVFCLCVVCIHCV
jgi:hypothetical protein